MILQILLTIVFGFGVLTLATVALLNTAGHRLHDGERRGFANQAVQFEYKYPTDDAARLRWWFAGLPIWLGMAASIAVISVGALYVSIGARPRVRAGEGVYASHLDPLSIVTWVGMGLYVLALVIVTTCLSRRLYTVLQDVEPI